MLKIEQASGKGLDQFLELLLEQFLEHDIQVNAVQLKHAVEQLSTQDSLGFVLTAGKNEQLAGFCGRFIRLEPFTWGQICLVG
jgi:hypothetical protein